MKIADWQSKYVNPFMKGGGILYDKSYENDVWYQGDEDRLAEFYQNYTDSSIYLNIRDNYFYANVPNKFRVVHSGLPSLISRTKARVLFNDDIEIVVNDDAENEETQRLMDILNDNKYVDMNKDGAITESYNSKFAWKISFDTDLTPYPIIEMSKTFEEIKERGRLQGIDFMRWIEKDKNKYCLHEIYGKGFIDYRLTNEKGQEVPLTTLEETSMLARIEFNAQIILASVKYNINKQSDYKGLYSEFDALDEVWSSYMDTVRKSKTRVYIPENLLAVDSNGRFIMPNEFETRVAKLGTDMSESSQNKVITENTYIPSTNYVESVNALVSNIVANVGLSQITIGLEATSGANESAVARREKEKTTLRTRSEMIQSWTQFLQSFYNVLLQADDIANSRTVGDYDIAVTFSEYISDSVDDKIKSLMPLKLNEVVDNEFILDELFDLDEETKARLLNQDIEDEIDEPME